MPGFDHTHYVPILKGRSSELTALSRLSQKAVSAITPLIEYPAIPANWSEHEVGARAAGKDIAQHLAESNPKLSAGLPVGKRFFLDGANIERDHPVDGREPLAIAMDWLRSQSRVAIPVVGIRRIFEYLVAAREINAQDRLGFCLRVSGSDLAHPDVNARLGELLEFLATAPNQVDFLVDYGEIDDDRVAAITAELPARISGIPRLSEWRTLTVAATAIPRTLSNVRSESTKEFIRHEMAIWLSLHRNRAKLKRMPSFGDYTTVHPVFTEIDPRLINKSPSIKFSGPHSWFIARGKGRPKKKRDKDKPSAGNVALSDAVQYPKLAAQIMAAPAWRGQEFSWGSQQIAECVRKKDAKKKATGGSGRWIQIAVSHHIEVVVDQLANLSGS